MVSIEGEPRLVRAVLEALMSLVVLLDCAVSVLYQPGAEPAGRWSLAKAGSASHMVVSGKCCGEWMAASFAAQSALSAEAVGVVERSVKCLADASRQVPVLQLLARLAEGFCHVDDAERGNTGQDGDGRACIAVWM